MRVKVTDWRLIVVSVVGLAVLAALAAWWLWLRPQPLAEGLIQANGRIEGDHYTVAPKVSGRIAALLVREGDTVAKDQVLVRLDDAGVKARVEQARARLTALKAQLEAARTGLEILRRDVPLVVAAAEAGVRHAEAALAEAEARLAQARRDATRFRNLLKRGSVDKYRTERSELALKVAGAARATAQAALIQARKQLAKARLGNDRIRAKEFQVAALEAQVSEARAALDEVLSILADLTVKAPADGTITTRIADTGEVVVAGSPLLDIVDLDRLYLKVYVAEKDIGKVRLGLPAQVYTDAFPGRPFPATVRYIAAQAQFTPKEVQTPDERIKLVYEVRLYLDDNPDHRLTPGLPADAVIRWREETPWARPRW